MARIIRPLIVILACWALSILCSGCFRVGPDFTPPTPPVADTWLETDDPRVKTDSQEYREWWRAFQDDVLDRLIGMAYRDNLTLHIAGVRVLEAQAQLGIAAGRLYPQTQQAIGSLEKDRLSARSPQASPGAPLTYAQTQVGLSASWELDFWGKYRRAIESADASLQAAVAEYDNALVSLTGEVAATYVNIRTLEKRLAIARQNVDIQKESLQIATARFTGGTTSQRDVEQAKTILAATEALIPTLEIQLRQTKNALCVLLGLPPTSLKETLTGGGGIPSPAPTVVAGIPADLIRRRPDIRRAEYLAWAQCAQIGVARAELFPAFSLLGNFGFLSSDVNNFALGDLFNWKSRTGAMGPTLRWNILNYGQITNLVRVQDARFQQLLLAYQNTVLKAQQEVEDALIAFLRTQERARFLGESTAAALRSLELAVLQYREGITDFTTVITAQQALLNEQDSLASTLGDIARSLVSLYRALGGGWQLREGQELVPPAIQAIMAGRTNWGRLLTPTGAAPLPTAPPDKHLIRPPQW